MKGLALLGALLLLGAPIFENEKPAARDITAECVISLPGGAGAKALVNKSELDSAKIAEGEILIESETAIGGVYIIWRNVPGEWNLDADGEQKLCGQNGFLHEYVGLEGAHSLTIGVPAGGFYMREIYIFSEGTLPEWVQLWQPPLEKADILLMSTHADDEHLFFAGILPYYAGEIGAAVQVSYFVYHHNEPARTHELLNGLWTVGVTAYPVIGQAPDLYSTSLAEAERGFAAAGFTEDDFIAFQVEQIRAFCPQVVINHDVDGEYGHGAHMLNSLILQKAVEAAADRSAFPELAERYGVWDVPKVYLHLWKENTVTMDWDVPLERFGGKTAFEVSQLGFLTHKSQHWTWFYDWMMGTGARPVTSAAQIKRYSPREYGLYRSTVGPDSGINDFLENITMYKDVLPEPEPEPEPPPEPEIPPEPETPPEPEPMTAPVYEYAPARAPEKDSSPRRAALFISAGAAAPLIILSAALARSRGTKKKVKGTDV